MSGSIRACAPAIRILRHASLGLLALVALAVGAQAEVDPTATALQVAQAMETEPGTVLEAEWMLRPPGGTPSAVATTILAEFPVTGDTYAILSTGDVRDAENPDPRHKANTDNGGLPVRGESDHDTLVLRVRVHACTAGAVSFDHRFLTEEDRWVGGNFNDTFVAELGASTWTVGKTDTTAPDAFAITAVNSAELLAAHAAGTSYGAATPIRTATVDVPAGDHDLYLSIYDVGRPTFDSAVFLDNLRVPTDCEQPCEEDCDPACDPACVDQPCPGGGHTGASGAYDLEDPRFVALEHHVASDCAPCPAAPAAWHAGEGGASVTGMGPQANVGGEAGLDGCIPPPCSASTPLLLHYEAGTEGVGVTAWPDGTGGGFLRLEPDPASLQGGGWYDADPTPCLPA